MSQASAVPSQVMRSARVQAAPSTSSSEARSNEEKNVYLFLAIAPLSYALALTAILFFR